ncbi:alpha/beta hydrolase [Streptomyces sp. NBC_00554]|uniref:alpha/beta hydrolase family protein n=1 Tax=Streptomyces sp. NBC_00554 TaxID=2903661 RepID=UPI00352E6E49|nr:alpha/beta hydrolase [Streptomyces sp. NBC_00554]
MSTGVEVSFDSLDGLQLQGTMLMPDEILGSPTVLVHGGGVNRDEGGFFTRLAIALKSSGMPCLRFDFRGHGESQGDQESLTLLGVSNDIRTAVDYLISVTGKEKVNIIGASFSGGICAFYAAHFPDSVQRLVLFNPLMDYKKRFIDDKPYWNNGYIDAEKAEELRRQGAIEHSPTFKLGRPLLNEVFYVKPKNELPSIQAPTLIVHGTKDTFIPIQSSREVLDNFGGGARLIEIDGAQHGFAVHDDPKYLNPQTQAWQSRVIRDVVEWLKD